MQLVVRTPDELIFEGTIEVVTIPTTIGIISVYPGHVPLITTCVAGELEVEVVEGKGVQSFAIGDGVVRVNDNVVEILAQEIVSAEGVDITKAQEAAVLAQKYLDETDIEDQEQFAKLQAELQRELAKVSVGNKYRSDLDRPL
jgi:F-type H+-transporting ATPase subunit epsilon